jgi:hypothetical protein
MLSTLKSQVELWRKTSFFVGKEGAVLARFAYARRATKCQLHTSATQRWTDCLSQPSSIQKTCHRSCITERFAFGGLRSWSSAPVATKKEDGQPPAELSDRYILSRLLVHIWPPDNYEFRGRVVGALALLAGSKLLNIQVLVYFTN